MLYVCYTHAQPIRSQQCTGRQGQHGGHSGVTLQQHSLANQKPGMCGGAFHSANTAERKQPYCLVWFGRVEPERQGYTTEQAEPSMQATELSPSRPSARFARFDSRPVNGLWSIKIEQLSNGSK